MTRNGRASAERGGGGGMGREPRKGKRGAKAGKEPYALRRASRAHKSSPLTSSSTSRGRRSLASGDRRKETTS